VGRSGFSVHLRRDGCFDLRRYPYPGEGAELRHPSAAQQPGQDVKVGRFVVFARDQGVVGFRGAGEHGEHFR